MNAVHALTCEPQAKDFTSDVPGMSAVAAAKEAKDKANKVSLSGLCTVSSLIPYPRTLML